MSGTGLNEVLVLVYASHYFTYIPNGKDIVIRSDSRLHYSLLTGNID
jgi:hypothetical protein